MSDPSNIRVERGEVTVVAFDRPKKKNALTEAMYTDFADALAVAAADDSVHVVLVTGTAGCFTAGNDLADFLQHPPAGEDSPVFRVLRALATFPKPLVAAVDGIAIGLGTTLLLHCDLVYCSDRARFQMPFVNLGLTPEGGSSYLLPLLVGHARAAEWLLLGDAFSAEEALRGGLVNAVVPADALDALARERCAALAKKAPAAVRAAKELLRGPQRAALSAAMSREGAEFVRRLSSPEAIAAFTRFLAPR